MFYYIYFLNILKKENSFKNFLNFIENCSKNLQKIFIYNFIGLTIDSISIELENGEPDPFSVLFVNSNF